jgi:DNA-binding IclR family transcriptional regulator
MARPKLVGQFSDRIIDRSSNPGVKSARRVLELFEFFDDVRREATVVQIAEALNIPQSSTSALVHDLVEFGYLHYDAMKRTYMSSPRVAMLGSWMDGRFAHEGSLVQMAQEIHEETRLTVCIAARNGMFAQYIKVVHRPGETNIPVGTGHMRPIVSSGAGLALLSTLRDPDIARIVIRANAEADDDSELIKSGDLLAEVAEVRARGYSAIYASTGRSCGLIAAPIVNKSPFPTMAVGVCGTEELLKDNEQDLGRVLVDMVATLETRMIARI